MHMFLFQDFGGLTRGRIDGRKPKLTAKGLQRAAEPRQECHLPVREIVSIRMSRSWQALPDATLSTPCVATWHCCK